MQPQHHSTPRWAFVCSILPAPPVPLCAGAALLGPMLRWSRPTPQAPLECALAWSRWWCQRVHRACNHRYTANMKAHCQREHFAWIECTLATLRHCQYGHALLRCHTPSHFPDLTCMQMSLLFAHRCAHGYTIACTQICQTHALPWSNIGRRLGAEEWHTWDAGALNPHQILKASLYTLVLCSSCFRCPAWLILASIESRSSRCCFSSMLYSLKSCLRTHANMYRGGRAPGAGLSRHWTAYQQWQHMYACVHGSWFRRCHTGDNSDACCPYQGLLQACKLLARARAKWHTLKRNIDASCSPVSML